MRRTDGAVNVLMTSFSMRSSFMGLVGAVFCSAWMNVEYARVREMGEKTLAMAVVSA